MILVLITVPEKDAKKVAKNLLDKQLCGCVNIIDSIESLFLWHGKIDREKESLLIVKTIDGLFKKLEREVIRVHPYDVPEIISFKLNKVSKPYASWLKKELSAVDNVN
ncbi:MAG: divalent-cation tolerance protein CutA [Candidatus Omnitrophica bacterium]|nr:divalent-cation tolerance protein CutA [Candidatus Omnitrophota bacterium]MCF7892043.1 divalent-cation tolerance protein CutA [Candidatus Omnitrophota bacterium]MCF7897709.1 divalent-cation tolerance protein CutA [Candidatus Omnitrophota bacterium]MCF7909546.1 divalent-cation tolerance protein CutA [Candidatus Omnitrophota bacterium]